jgi:hypothetical protein
MENRQLQKLNIAHAPLGFKQAESNIFDCCEPLPGMADIYL